MGKITSFLLAMMIFSSLTINAQEEASTASLYNDGLEKLKAKNFEEALPLIEKALEVADPEADAQVIQLAKKNGAIAAYYVGNDLRKDEDCKKALETYEKGAEWSPGFYANYIGVAQSLECQEKDVEALKAYLKAAEVSEAGKKADKAEQKASKAENMVALAYGNQDWDKTVTLGKTFLEASETADVHYYLAAALKNTGDAASAIAHAEKAAGMAADDKDKYLMLLAESYEAGNDKSKAIETYKQITDNKYSERAQYKVNELEGGR